MLRFSRLLLLRGTQEAPLQTHFAVGTGNYDHVTIRVTQPDLSVLRPGIDMWLQDDLSMQCSSFLNYNIKVANLEPQKDPMTRCCRSGVGEVRVILLIPGVELKNHLTGALNPVVYITMDMVGEGVRPKQFAIPATASPYIFNSDQWLNAESCTVYHDLTLLPWRVLRIRVDHSWGLGRWRCCRPDVSSSEPSTPESGKVRDLALA